MGRISSISDSRVENFSQSTLFFHSTSRSLVNTWQPAKKVQKPQQRTRIARQMYSRLTSRIRQSRTAPRHACKQSNQSRVAQNNSTALTVGHGSTPPPAPPPPREPQGAQRVPRMRRDRNGPAMLYLFHCLSTTQPSPWRSPRPKGTRHIDPTCQFAKAHHFQPVRNGALWNLE